MERVLRVNGMHCRSCESLLSDLLGGIDGVQDAVADSRNGTVKVVCRDPQALDAAVDAIGRHGYRVVG